MNEKGFAVSGIIYTLFLVFLIIMMSILTGTQNKKKILDKLKQDTLKEVQSNVIIP
ncbi:MAG: hypothetical protein ACK5HP_01470 [Bacilli bacterium]